MTAIQIVSVQHPVGRPTTHVLAFGYRTSDTRRRIVQVALTVSEAVDIISAAQAARAFPEIEVPDWAWAHCLNTGDVKMVHFEEPA